MPIIRVEMFKGRTIDQKKELVKELTDSFVKTCGGKADGLHIIIDEVNKENWGISGVLSSENNTNK